MFEWLANIFSIYVSNAFNDLIIVVLFQIPDDLTSLFLTYPSRYFPLCKSPIPRRVGTSFFNEFLI